MNDGSDINSLIAMIQKHQSVLDRLETYYLEYVDTRIKQTIGEHADAVVIADTIGKYYTCLETVFLRISKVFENELSATRWHHDLLDRMTLDIAKIRPAVIGEKTYRVLRELLRFRHFSRYYFEMDYDWDRLIFIQKKFVAAIDLVRKDLADYVGILQSLIEE